MSRTHITFLIDRSGSMDSQYEGVKKGFHKFVEDQRAVPGECRMTVIQFDSTDPCEILVDNQSLDAIGSGALDKFVPRDMTPLYDATAKAIRVTEQALANQKPVSVPADITDPLARMLAASKPDHVVFVVFTDGLENHSQEYDFSTLTDLVKRKEKEGWTFVYLGANHDAYAQGQVVTSSVGNKQTYAGSSAGAMSAYNSVSSGITRMRSGLKGAGGQSVQDFFVDEMGKDDKEAENGS